MAKLNIDTVKIRNGVIPAINNATKSTSSALSQASNVSFPHGDFDWGNVKGKISHCQDALAKYSKWINRIAEDADRQIPNSIDEVNSVEIEKIKPITNKVV